MKKNILFVINTMSKAGAEVALLALLELLAKEERYELELFVLMGQGELAAQLPPQVHLVNERYLEESVLTAAGRRGIYQTIVQAFFRHGNGIRLLPYLLKAFVTMQKNGTIWPDKLLWRVLSDGAQRLSKEYDLAIAFLEGGSAYYVADHVKAKKKAAFIHTDYTLAGYTRSLDRDCYLQYDRIFPIGEMVRKQFLKVYPELTDKTKLFSNVVNQEEIKRKAKLPGGFSDLYSGIRILTVGRLTKQKAYSVAIETMRLLKAEKIKARWYVLGEGPEREMLEKQIEKASLQEDFLLLGAVENPYPYYAQTDLYVHATEYEGKSIAVQEALTLGCAIVVSEGSAELIQDGENGQVCALDAQKLKNTIRGLIEHPKRRAAYGEAAAAVKITNEKQQKLLEELL